LGAKETKKLFRIRFREETGEISARGEKLQRFRFGEEFAETSAEGRNSRDLG
jgi:hypothetical protein